MMAKRTINAWGTHQDAYVDSVLGYSLKREIVEVLGAEKYQGAQLGNICGWLTDMGRPDLATDIKQTIAEHNGERGPRDQ